MLDYNYLTPPKHHQNITVTTKMIAVAIVLAFLVIVLGAYTRLTNAGLGCPDWPGCYGKMIVSNSIIIAENGHATKAWTEMIHRYIAGSLGILVITIVSIILFNKYKNRKYLVLPILLLLTIIFQALLGMWTVTLKLLPTVVMGHLIGGFITITLLVLLLLEQFKFNTAAKFSHSLKNTSFITLLIVFIQIILGGWTSSNYAALPCLDFPTCNGQWLPSLDTLDALNPFLTAGVNYEGGILNNAQRVTIQLFHRWGALVSSIFIIITALSLRKYDIKYYNKFSTWMIALLIIQVTLGIVNVKFALPLITAVMHNAVACLLLITLVTLNYKITKK